MYGEWPKDCSSLINIVKCLLVQLITKLSDARSFFVDLTFLVAGFIVDEGPYNTSLLVCHTFNHSSQAFKEQASFYGAAV